MPLLNAALAAYDGCYEGDGTIDKALDKLGLSRAAAATRMEGR